MGKVLAGIVFGLMGVSGINGSCVVRTEGVGGLPAGAVGSTCAGAEPDEAARGTLGAQPTRIVRNRIAHSGTHLFIMM